ncbi:MAG: hypothetical protein V4574_13015 [Pseudomonadota bacterium]
MKRDWLWGWLAVPFAAIVTLLSAMFLRDFGLSDTVIAAIAAVIAISVGLGTMYLGNQLSIRRIRRNGGEVELVIRPWDAVVRGVLAFPWFVGVYTLVLHVFGIEGRWPYALMYSASFALLHGLQRTAYRKQA